MVSNKLYGNSSVQAILLKRQKDGTTRELPLAPLSTKTLQAYREGKPLPKLGPVEGPGNKPID